jgi:hypothetical protein
MHNQLWQKLVSTAIQCEVAVRHTTVYCDGMEASAGPETGLAFISLLEGSRLSAGIPAIAAACRSEPLKLVVTCAMSAGP